MKEIFLFNLSLIITLILTRTSAHLFHDYKNYGTKKEKSKTVTGWLRIKLKKDIHHFHLGLLIFVLILPLIFFFGVSKIKIIFLGIGLSLIIDQITPILDNKKNYFKKEQIFTSIVGHLIVVALSFFIFGN